jgi:hypothetical protein
MLLALTDLFRAKWTDAIHEEWMRSVIEKYPDRIYRLANCRESCLAGTDFLRRCFGGSSLTSLLGLEQPSAVHRLQMFEVTVDRAVSLDQFFAHAPDFIDDGIFHGCFLRRIV